MRTHPHYINFIKVLSTFKNMFNPNVTCELVPGQKNKMQTQMNVFILICINFFHPVFGFLE